MARAVLGGVMVLVVGGGVFFAASLFWLPRSITYRIAAGVLTVEARYSLITERRQLPLAQLEGIEKVRLQGGRRHFGTALPGFCVGVFSYEGVGKVWQATNCAGVAFLVRGRGLEMPLLITPAQPGPLREALASGGELTAAPAPVPPGDGMAIARWLLALGVVGVPWLAALCFLAPARLRYRVRPGELEVAGMVTRRRWPLAGVIVRRFRPSSAIRLMGTALPGYFIGLFRMAGTTVRVAGTHLGEGVLVEGPRRVFVTPADPEAFLAALEQAGAVRGAAE